MEHIYKALGIRHKIKKDKILERNLTRWLIAILIISIIFIFISTLYQYDITPMSYSHYNVMDSSSLKDIMNVDKIHPPPLFNFMDYYKPM